MLRLGAIPLDGAAAPAVIADQLLAPVGSSSIGRAYPQ
jgi:hypothetical protein